MHVKDENIEIFELNTKYFDYDKFNLIPKYYNLDIVDANQILDRLKSKGIKIKTIKDFSNYISVPGRFKTTKSDKYIGNPYLSPKDTFLFPFSSSKYVIKYPEELNVVDNDILITCSGTIGRTVIVNEILKDFVISNDMIRLNVPNNKLGYVFAYLNTHFAQIFIKSNEYGATVKHINEEHISDLKIPSFKNSIEEKINNQMIKSHKIRESAHLLLNESMDELYKVINLPIIDVNNINEKELISDYKINKSFILNSNDLNLRFDVSYHNPVHKLNKNNLEKKGNSEDFDIINLEDLVDIFTPPRFKRNYTSDKNISVPFLQGSHITQIKPQGMKRLYNKTKNMKEILIKKNMILLTRSGTVGKLSLVGDYWDNWAASDHIMRLSVKRNSINPGYLLLFLLSDYAQFQIERLIYGSNVNEIGESGNLINKIRILVPKDKYLEECIGNKVIKSYSLRDTANILEDKTIKYLENLIFSY